MCQFQWNCLGKRLGVETRAHATVYIIAERIIRSKKKKRTTYSTNKCRYL
jgi:hypothetical protein